MSARDEYAAMFESLAGRVRACSGCSHPQKFQGFEEAHQAGWSWKLGNQRIVWWCKPCAAEAAAAEADAFFEGEDFDPIDEWERAS